MVRESAQVPAYGAGTASEQQAAMRAGARTAVRTCMNVTSVDRVFVLTDRPTHAVGQLLGEEASAAGAQTIVADLEQYAVRPVLALPDGLRADVAKFQPTVTFYAASSQPGEIRFRMTLRTLLTEELRVRHAHMPGVSEQLLREGMNTDYLQVAAITGAVYEKARAAQAIRVTTPDGTEFTAHFDPARRWVPCNGLYHQPGQRGNLPEGEVFTCPVAADGRLVAHVIGDYFSEKYGVLASPVIFEVRGGVVVAVSCENAALAAEIEAYLDSAENGRRVGEFAIGTNIGLHQLVGNLLQDEKIPGVHVAFGNPYAEETGADWTSTVHVDVIPVQCTIRIDGAPIMTDGEFDYAQLRTAGQGDFMLRLTTRAGS